MGFYDNEVKRVCENNPRLLIMAVNSIFKKNHDINCKVIFLDNELPGDSISNPQFLDKLIEIEDAKYHIEFQLLEGKMAVRMYEYAVKESIRTLPEDSDKYEIDIVMPHQTVIFLAGANKKPEIRVNLTLPDEQKVSYIISCISASETVDDLCKENLYILLPFQMVQLNDRMNRLNGHSTIDTRKRLAMEICEYKIAVKLKLEKLVEDDIIKAHEKESLLESAANIENYIRDKDRQVNAEVHVMGDENYVAWSDRLRLEGMEKGREINLIEQIIKKVRKEKDLATITNEVEESIETVSPMYQAVINHPQKSAQEIYVMLHPSGFSADSSK